MQKLKRRILSAAAVFFVLNAIGVVGYYWLADGEASLVDALYMTVTTLGAVGFGEITKNASSPVGRLFTMGLIYSGMVTLVFVTTQLTAFFVEGELARLLEKRRMDKRIDSFTDHYIVCGAGATGVHVIRELYATKRPVIFIERDAERARAVIDELGENKMLAYVLGDASDDLLLEKAGVAHAAGVVAALPDDKDNLFITIAARQLSSTTRIIARASDSHAIERIKRAGAQSVISPNMIGGMRMVSELVRPSVVTFLDLMLRDKDKNMRIEEVTLTPSTPFVTQTLVDLELRRRFDCQVLAVRPSGETSFSYNPSPQTTMAAGMVLIVLGSADAVSKLRLAAAETAATA